MKGARGWVIAGAIAVVIAVAALLLQPKQDSPEHSTDSDAANGASAALLFSQAMGHPTDQITGSFGTPAERSVMFVFTRTRPYTADEADRIHQWVLASGGILIYASEQADPELDRAFGVKRLGGFVSGVEYQGTPVVDGVIRVAGGDGMMPLDPSPNQVPILRTGSGFVAGFVQRIGLGKLVVLADPLVICNGYLERADRRGMVGGCGPAAAAFERTRRDARPSRRRHRARGGGADGSSAAAARAVLECSLGARTGSGGRAGPDRDLAVRLLVDGAGSADCSQPAPRDRPSAAEEIGGAAALTDTASATPPDFFARVRAE